MRTKRKQILAGLAVAIASVAVTAPAAHADDWYNGLENGLETAVVRPDDRSDARGPGAALGVTVVRPDDRAVRVSPSVVVTAVRPDDRAVRVSPATPVEPVVLPDDRAGVRGPGAAPDPTPATILVSPNGFTGRTQGSGQAWRSA
jgi:hypothetical protein